MLIGLINKSLAIYGHHAPPRAPVEKWRAGETVWDGFMAPLYVVFLVRKLKLLGLVVDGIPASFCHLQGFAAVCQRFFTAFTNGNSRSACFCQWCA